MSSSTTVADAKGDEPIRIAFIATLTIATAMLVVALWLSGAHGMDTWMYSYYFLNFEQGIVRRGFIGEILRLLSVPLSNTSTSLAYSVALLAAWIVFVRTIWQTFASPPVKDSFLLFGFIAFCPALALHFTLLDFGRFDVFLVLSLFLSGLAAARIERWTGLAAITFLQVMACFIHEAALLLTAPLAFALWSIRFHRSTGYAPALVGLGIVGPFTLAIWNFGQIDAASVASLVDDYSRRSVDGTAIEAQAIAVITYDVGAATGSLYFATLTETLFHHLLFFVALSPYWIVILAMLKAVRRSNDAVGVLAIAAVLSPLALYLLGHDFFRWWTFVILNSFTLVVFCASLDRQVNSSVLDSVSKLRIWMVLGVLSGLVLGGTGDKESFRPELVPLFVLVEALR